MCELCHRQGTPLTRHHLLPQCRHNKGSFRRKFDRQEGLNRIALLCTACHSCIHSVLSEKELESTYNTVDSLKAHPEIAKFAAWVATKAPGFQPLSRKHSSFENLRR